MDKGKEHMVHKFAKSELLKFVLKHSKVQLSCIDDIIIDYMVSILEGVGSNSDEFETSFDVDEFTEMISEFIEEFSVISSDFVADWMFSLARRIENGSYLSSVIETTSLKESTVQYEKPQNEEVSQKLKESNKCYVKPEFNTLLPVEIPSSLQWLKCTNDEIIESLFPDDEIEQAISDMDIGDVKENNPYSTYRNESPSSEEVCTDETYSAIKIKTLESPIKMSNHEKMQKLLEMFNDIPESQLKKCLSRFKGNLEKAIKYLVGSRSEKHENTNVDDEEKDECQFSSLSVDPITEQSVTLLKEVFPDISETRIKDRLLIVGGDIEKTTQVLLAENNFNASHIKNKFKIHKVSSKKTQLSQEEQTKLKERVVSTYGYWEEKSTIDNMEIPYKQQSHTFDDVNVEKTCEVKDDDGCVLSSVNKENKPHFSSKPKRKTRFR